MIVAGPPLRFLVVDDDADVQDALAGFVERLGHVAHRASDGVEAVGALALQTFDFMLLDLTMPRMSGEDVLRWLRAHPGWGRGLRVIVVSARAQATTRRPDGVAADAVLPKPLRFEELRDVVGGLHPSSLASASPAHVG